MKKPKLKLITRKLEYYLQWWKDIATDEQQSMTRLWVRGRILIYQQILNELKTK